MDNNLSKLERRILAAVQKGLPLTARPYEDLARQLGIETEQLLTILERWKSEGVLRRMGAVLDPRKLGLSAAALVAWQAEPDHIEQAGQTLAEFSQVTHCYERQTAPGWPYNLYTMLHAKDDSELDRLIEQMSRKCGLTTYKVLRTRSELKKTPPTYIRDDDTL